MELEADDGNSDDQYLENYDVEGHLEANLSVVLFYS